MKNKLMGIQDNMAKEALRNILWAYRDLEAGMGGPLHDDVSTDHPHLKEIEEVRDGAK
jgi:hypothetical protein